jgi:hypothetical protein
MEKVELRLIEEEKRSLEDIWKEIVKKRVLERLWSTRAG